MGCDAKRKKMKHYFPTGRRIYGRLFEETSGYVRPERVYKWINSMTDDDDNDDGC